jgi:RNA polymerase sigma-70 factor (ECF subfamily)
MRLTKRPSDAEDLVAEAVAKAWAAFDTLSDDARFRPWIFRVLINTFRSHQRKHGREVSIDEGADAEGVDEFWLFDRLCQPFLLWWSNPEQDFLTKVLREDLQRALDALPDCYGAAIALVIVEGCSYQEAADILDIPLGTIRSRVRRGRSLLQKALWVHAQEAGLDRANEEDEATDG